MGISSGLITNKNSEVTVLDCGFEGNQEMSKVDSSINYLIGNFYGKLELYDNCFIRNIVQVAFVLSQTAENDGLAVIAENNGQDQHSSATMLQSSKSCEFIASFNTATSDTKQRFIDITCIDFDDDTCVDIGIQQNLIDKKDEIVTSNVLSSGIVFISYMQHWFLLIAGTAFFSLLT